MVQYTSRLDDKADFDLLNAIYFSSAVAVLYNFNKLKLISFSDIIQSKKNNHIHRDPSEHHSPPPH